MPKFTDKELFGFILESLKTELNYVDQALERSGFYCYKSPHGVSTLSEMVLNIIKDKDEFYMTSSMGGFHAILEAGLDEGLMRKNLEEFRKATQKSKLPSKKEPLPSSEFGVWPSAATVSSVSAVEADYAASHFVITDSEASIRLKHLTEAIKATTGRKIK